MGPQGAEGYLQELMIADAPERMGLIRMAQEDMGISAGEFAALVEYAYPG